MTGVTVIQLIIALGLFNVWLLRPRSETAYRGGAARSLREEFREYGLPSAVFYLVGTLKISAALMLIAGFWFPAFVVPAASVVAFLMLGAIVMHLKIKDPPTKSLPALTMLLMNVALLYLTISPAA